MKRRLILVAICAAAVAGGYLWEKHVAPYRGLVCAQSVPGGVSFVRINPD